MLMVFLFILLALVIIFRNEIKSLIGYGFIAFLALGLWQIAWWGKVIVIVMGILFILGLVAKGIEFFKGRDVQKGA